MKPLSSLASVGFLLLGTSAPAAAPRQENPGSAYLSAHYEKREVRVPMRDGVRLFTTIYVPRKSQTPFPILLRRTPYSVAPYGANAFPDQLGPSRLFVDAGYGFALQDVRGAYMSEGEFVDMRPHDADKRAPEEIDESTDAFDTIAWLVANVERNNGRVGMWGISYPGFYAAAGMIDAHPALRAVSPQAPIADWWYDDFHHHGALFLPHAFNFLSGFGRPRPSPTTTRGPGFAHGTPDGYRFFLELGPLKDVEQRWFKGPVPMWRDLILHPDYDAYWQARNLLPHLRKVAPAVLTVGGWFDAEDLYGPLKTYQQIERLNPGIENSLVMGPWAHGGWARSDGDRLGQARFGEKTSLFYRREIEFPFFERHLRDVRGASTPEATVFDTGANRWRSFGAWPPRDAQPAVLAPNESFGLVFVAEDDAGGGAERFVEFVSDPARPVPFTAAVTTGMDREYMTHDQRFVATRPDVVVMRSEPLEEDLTLAGPVAARLDVTTTGTDADWIVKWIDEFPPDAAEPSGDQALPAHQRMAGYQMLVRSEVVRGRYRKDPSHPIPFVPGERTQIDVPLLDLLHTFRKGHRIQVQIHCTWFPLVDRNPQTFVKSIYDAAPQDFVRATQRVHGSSRFEVRVLR